MGWMPLSASFGLAYSSLLAGRPPDLLRLRAAVLRAHYRSAKDNPCGSSQTFRLAAAGSGDFGKAVVAAISTFGGKHGPVEEARKAIYAPGHATVLLASDQRVPGWGNSFYSGAGGDPAWKEVAPLLPPEEHNRLEAITGLLHEHGKTLYPNAAAYTAVAAKLLDVPPGAELSLVIEGRLPAWVEIFAEEAG